MTLKLISATLVVATAAAPSMAQQFTGAEAQLKYQAIDTPDTDFEVTSLSGGIEATIAPTFGLGANLLIDSIENQDDALLNSTLHVMYLPSPSAAVGVFYTNESQGDFDVASYGLEGGYATPNGGIDGHFGVVDSDDVDGADITYGGIGFAFDVGTSVRLGLSYDSFTVDDAIVLENGVNDLTTSDLSVFASYEVANGFSVFAEIGQISFTATDGDLVFETIDDSESTYISIGGEYTFERGTIFDVRGFNSIGR